MISIIKKGHLIFGLLISLVYTTQALALEVIFEEDRRVPIVYLSVATLGGYVEDPHGLEGLTAHLGSMLLRGTKTRTKSQIDAALDQMGASIGVETRAENLIIRTAVLRSQLPKFLSLLEDILLNPSFSQVELNKLKSESISDLLSAQSNDRYLAKRFFNQFLFQSHPYSIPEDGTIQSVKRFTTDNLKMQYEKLFVRERILIAGTGDTTFYAIRGWANSIGNKFKSGKSFKLDKVPTLSDRKKLYIIDKPDRSQGQILIGHVGLQMTHPDFFALYVGTNALGGSNFSARLMKEIRVKRGWSYGAYSYMKHGSQPHSWQTWLFPGAQYIDQAVSLTLDLIKEAKDNGITKEEFEFSKHSIINNSGFKFNTPEKRVENALIEQTLGLPNDFFKTFGDQVEKVSLNQVNKALKEHLHPDKSVIAVVITAKDHKESLMKAAGVDANSTFVVDYRQ